MIFLQTAFSHINSFITSHTSFHSNLPSKELEASTLPQAQPVIGGSSVKKGAAIEEATAQAVAEPTVASMRAVAATDSPAASLSSSHLLTLSSPSTLAAKPQIRTLVISSSLRDGSRSRKLALKIQEKIAALELPCDFLDMRDYRDLPLCDGKSCYANATVQALSKTIAKASNIILAFPVYNYDCNAVAKNLIDLTGTAWKDKVVGLIATAGSARSFMSPLNLANSLMINSNCMVVPKYVFADVQDFPERTDTLTAEMDKRLDTLAKTSTKLAICWNQTHAE